MTDPQTCPHCGQPMTGVAFLDGTDAEGNHIGWAEPYCGCQEPKPTPFGEALRRRRIDARISLRDVQDRTGIPFVAVSQVEDGAIPPHRQWVIDLARLLDADPDEWLALAEQTGVEA